MQHVDEVEANDPDLVRLVAAQQTELGSRYGDTDDHGFTQPPLHKDTRWLLLTVDGEPAGCAAVQPLSHTAAGAPPDAGEVKRLYVAPAFRGRGLSRLLMDELEQLAARAGYTVLQLETGLRQPEALSLYRDSGWTEIMPYGHYRDSGLSVSFSKTLPRG